MQFFTAEFQVLGTWSDTPGKQEAQTHKLTYGERHRGSDPSVKTE